MTLGSGPTESIFVDSREKKLRFTQNVFEKRECTQEGHVLSLETLPPIHFIAFHQTRELLNTPLTTKRRTGPFWQDCAVTDDIKHTYLPKTIRWWYKPRSMS